MLLQLLSHLQFSPTRNRLLCLSCFSVHVACFLPLWLLIRFLSLVLLNLVFMFLVLGVGWLCRFIYSSNLEHLGLVSSVFFFFLHSSITLLFKHSNYTYIGPHKGVPQLTDALFFLILFFFPVYFIFLFLGLPFHFY